MKKFLPLFVFAVVSNFVFAQQATIKLKISGAKDLSVKILLPIDGTTFYPNLAEKVLNKDSTLILQFPVEKISKIGITTNDRNFKFFIEPGESHINLNLQKKNFEAVEFSGSSKEGQLLLNQRKYVFYQSRANKYSKLDTTAVGILSLIKTDEEKELKPFNELLANNKISPAFYELMKNEISFNYAAIAAHVPTVIYFASSRENSKVIFKKEFQDLWANVYAEHPVDDVAGLNATDFYDYASYYSIYYKLYYQGTLNGTFTIPKVYDENENLRFTYQSFVDNFNGKVKEYLLASFLHNELIQKKYQSVLIELFEKFKSAYPKSNYTNLLEPAVEQVRNYQAQAKTAFNKDQKFVANYSEISSLAELTSRFKGKTVFVDIWATWCEPCKAEFEYNAGLEKYLKANGAEMLFISMDKDRADQQWKEMIKFYKLSGNHLRTNQQLQQDMINTLWDGKGYSIPRYLIIKDGKIVVNNALRPSDKDALYKQISENL